ncbi:hypothetical protein J010_04122 [Cryptococcus neoformans]|nr:hypothetical protein C368_04382 [Cryptococcus neoformans var. grubii 125.91]OXG48882.1 hypothetical protein C355_04021 [Cryptococcus neoformans var. grubii Th84]OXH08070.1 hypothetical protein J010_04122 [Cryptococcus neoformans var. grubii]OXH29163.1 hypothetical protein J009_04133 [Cryptococcus neoformans var. grubii]OXH49106.1 hypothetical protein J004_04184 [Cryptococcus neoformans var. grubii]
MPGYDLTDQTSRTKFTITPIKTAVQPCVSVVNPLANLYPGSKGENEPGSSRLLGYAKYNGRGKERDEAATTRRSSFKKLSAHTPLKGPETFLCTIVGIPEIDRANNHGLRGLEKGLDRMYASHDRAAAERKKPLTQRPKRRNDQRESTRTRPISSCKFGTIEGRTEEDDRDIVTEILIPSTTMGYTSTCTSRLFQHSNFDVLSECDFSPTNALSASHTSPRDHLVIRKNLSFSSDVFTEEDKVEDKAGKMKEVEVEVEVEERVTAKVGDQESKGEEEGGEMCIKIDDLSARIRAMTIQGRSALHAPLPGIDLDLDADLARRLAHPYPHASEQEQEQVQV